MALKKKVTKDEFAKLSKDLQTEYIEDGEGYRLDVDGDEDIGALKRAKDRESQLRKEAEKKLKEAEDKLNEIDSNDARKKGDIETLEKQWREKYEKKDAESQAENTRLRNHIVSQSVDKVASEIAAKISTSPSLILPHIKARLKASFDGDAPKTVVLDKDGKDSVLTIEQLSQEFVANKDFAAIIVKSKASGGAEGQNQKPFSGANNGDTTNKPFDFVKASSKEIAEHLKAEKAAKENNTEG